MNNYKKILNIYQPNFSEYILISIGISLTIICGANLFQILASSINPFEFDTVYVINMIAGFIKDGLPILQIYMEIRFGLAQQLFKENA